MICEKCGKPLRAFHYYRNNACSVYCEKCAKPYHACHAAPYRTIELVFSGIQREGISLTLEIDKWPSLEHSYMRWYEWNWSGGSQSKVDLPTNYILEHTVDEFIDEYILKDNEVIKHIRYNNSEKFLNEIKNILIESGIFQK